MKRLIGLLLIHSTNVGEGPSSPLDYFKFPIPSEKMDAASYDPSEIRGQLVIYGGGGLIHLPAPDYFGGVMQYLEELCDLSPWLISWGVGHNIHRSKVIEYPQPFVKKFVLHGVRDFNQKILPVVPCASCMSTLIHHNYNASRAAVVVGHKPGQINSGLPEMEFGHGVSAKEAIEFVASAETVVTNSYHGAYWGYLLNRKVVVFDPMSTKFYGMPDGIVLSSKDKWQEDMRKAKPSKGFLNTCRKANRDYHKKVLTVVERFINA